MKKFRRAFKELIKQLTLFIRILEQWHVLRVVAIKDRVAGEVLWQVAQVGDGLGVVLGEVARR